MNKAFFYSLQVKATLELFSANIDKSSKTIIFTATNTDVNEWVNLCDSWLSSNKNEVEFVRLYCGKNRKSASGHSYDPQELQVVKVTLEETDFKYKNKGSLEVIEVKIPSLILENKDKSDQEVTEIVAEAKLLEHLHGLYS